MTSIGQLYDSYCDRQYEVPFARDEWIDTRADELMHEWRLDPEKVEDSTLWLDNRFENALIAVDERLIDKLLRDAFDDAWLDTANQIAESEYPGRRKWVRPQWEDMVDILELPY